MKKLFTILPLMLAAGEVQADGFLGVVAQAVWSFSMLGLFIYFASKETVNE